MNNEEAKEIFSKVKELPCGWCYEGGDEFKKAINHAFKAFEERPQGEWVVQRLSNSFDDVYCPFCNARPTRSEYGYYLKDKFCHECGADMRKRGVE